MSTRDITTENLGRHRGRYRVPQQRLQQRAVIFIPAGQIDLYADECLAHCAARGYHVVGVVVGNYAAATAMILDRIATVLVVARPEHLPPNRVPRVEVTGDGPPDDSPERRRPRRLR